MEILSSLHNKMNPNFNGIWGKKKLISKVDCERFACDNYERVYYPFKDESEKEIKRALNSKNSEYNRRFCKSISEQPNNSWIKIFCENCYARLGNRLELTKEECTQATDKFQIKFPKTIKEYKKLLKKINI